MKARVALALVISLLALPSGAALAGGGPPPGGGAAYATVHTNSGFDGLLDLASDAAGNLYLEDQLNYAIVKLSPSGRVLLRDKMPGECGIPSVAATPSGSVYAPSVCDHKIYHFSPSGRLVQQTGLKLNPLVTGLAVAGTGNVYALESAANPPNSIAELTPTLQPVQTFSLTAVSGAYQLTADGRGNLYVTANQGLFKLSSSGRIIWRLSQKQLGGYPIQPAVDPAGNVYTTGRGRSIIKVSSTGTVVRTVIQNGTKAGAVHHAAGLAVVGGTHLFVTQEGPNLIKEFSLGGQLQAIWVP